MVVVAMQPFVVSEFLAALDDVADLEGAPAATELAAPVGAPAADSVLFS